MMNPRQQQRNKSGQDTANQQQRHKNIKPIHSKKIKINNKNQKYILNRKIIIPFQLDCQKKISAVMH